MSTIQCHFPPKSTNFGTLLIYWESKCNWIPISNNVKYKSIKESLSEPYSWVWRQPITFKLLRADWPPPHNRRSGARRLASNFLGSSEFLCCKFKFLLGIPKWAHPAGQISISSCFQHGLQDGYLSIKPRVNSRRHRGGGGWCNPLGFSENQSRTDRPTVTKLGIPIRWTVLQLPWKF